MIWNIQIELPDTVGSQVLNSIAERKGVSISATPTEAEINEISQVVALEIYDGERMRIADKASKEAFDNAYNG